MQPIDDPQRPSADQPEEGRRPIRARHFSRRRHRDQQGRKRRDDQNRGNEAGEPIPGGPGPDGNTTEQPEPRRDVPGHT
jgi:hypothetical protein